MTMKDELLRGAQAIDIYIYPYMKDHDVLGKDGYHIFIFVYTLLYIGPIMMCKIL